MYKMVRSRSGKPKIKRCQDCVEAMKQDRVGQAALLDKEKAGRQAAVNEAARLTDKLKHIVSKAVVAEQEKAKQDILFQHEKAARQSAESTAVSLEVQLQDATTKAASFEQRWEDAKNKAASAEIQLQDLKQQLMEAAQQAEATSTKVPALEQQLQAMEAELLQKTQQLDTANAQNAELAEQVQGLTKSMEQKKCSLATHETELEDAHAEITILKAKLPESQLENTEARIQLEADMTPCMIKRLHQIIAQEAKDARIAHLTAELASKLENGTSKASAKVVLTEAGTTAIDTLMGITKKTAQAEVGSQAEQMPLLKQNSAEREATTVQAPKEMAVSRVQEEPHSGAVTAASAAAASGRRPSSQATQPTTVKSSAGHNRGQQQHQGNGRLSQILEGPPGYWAKLWVFKTSAGYRGPIPKVHLMGLHVRRMLPPNTQVMAYSPPMKGPRQAWSLRECAQAWHPNGCPSGTLSMPPTSMFASSSSATA
ncbi:hypothetical protein ABBQ32_011559 [Trebouxia sp. C0010 RCD-2024]